MIFVGILLIPQLVQAQAERYFSDDAGMMLNYIRRDRTKDFEAVMARVKEALERSSESSRQRQARVWTVFRGMEPGPDNTVLYVWIMDPVAKGFLRPRVFLDT